MKYWLITDTHFGHDKLVEYCARPQGFEGKIMENLYKTLSDDDVLIHLGDFCMGNDGKWTEMFMKQKKSKKWLIKGNHDHKTNSWYLNHGWDFVGKSIKDKFFGKNILFSHIPQIDDGWYDLNIHGHFHNSDHRKHEKELVVIKNPKQKLLAIEYTNYQPVLLNTFMYS
jgi:calcineurin-like phosphoesterase family protein